MMVSMPLLERACRRFPLDSEEITGLHIINDDFIEFNIYGSRSLCYYYDDAYEMLAPYEDLEVLMNDRLLHTAQMSWDDDETRSVADYLMEKFRDSGWTPPNDSDMTLVANGFRYRYDSPSGMHKAMVMVASGVDWIVEITKTIDTNAKRRYESMLDVFYRYVHRYDLPMGLV